MNNLIIIKNIGYQEYKDFLAKGMEAKAINAYLAKHQDKERYDRGKKWRIINNILIMILIIALLIFTLY